MTLIPTIAGAAVAVGLIVGAIVLLAGFAWAMIAAGVFLLAGLWLLYDPSGEGEAGFKGGP